MNDIKSVVAKNIAELRQASGLTQLELGEKLNYSDKAVSKWEHADSMPDISVLVEIADLFDVPLDYLVREEHDIKKEIKAQSKPSPQKIIVTAVSVLFVWFVAVAAFVTVSTCFKQLKFEWLTFIYAVPVSAIVWLVFNTLWFNRRLNYFIVSILMWSVLTVVHLSLLPFGVNFWMTYLLGIPGQVIILLLSLMRKPQKKEEMNLK